MKTKSAAIKHSRANVTFASQGNQWRVDTYSPAHRAWWQGTAQDYWQARANYTQALIDSARTFLELDPVEYDGGAWTSYL